MLQWQELSTLALLGTDRAKISPVLAEALEQYHIDSASNPSSQVLEAAATFGAMKRAGYVLETLDIAVNKPPIETNKNWCNANSSRHLKVILKQNQEDLLSEFLHYTNEEQKIIAPEFLPQLLNQCSQNKHLWKSLESIIGKRGLWLAQQNPTWQYLVHNNSEIDWGLADLEEKMALLHYWRKNDPAEAIDLLEWSWSDESVADKKHLLKTLEISLSLADEDFLEQCLDDKRKEIRILAVSYLETLEGSMLMQRRVARIRPLLTLLHSEQLGYKIEIQPFDELTKADIRDGLSLNLQWQKNGSEMGVLFHILKSIPPFYWETHFKLSKKELVESYVQSDWSLLLMQATIEAAAQYKDEKWCAHLLLFAIDHTHQNRWSGLQIDVLIPAISNVFFNKTAARLLDQGMSLLAENNILIQLLSNTDQTWDLELSKQLMHYFNSLLNDSRTPHWGALAFKNILKNAAYRCPPTSLEVLQRLISQDKMQWSIWEEDSSKFFKILKFRKDMVMELREGKL